MCNVYARHIESGGEQIVCQRCIQELTGVIKHELLVECVADPLRDSTVNLAIHNHWIDNGAAVMHHDIPLDLDHHRLRIDLDDDGVSSACSRADLGTEIASCFQTGFGSRPHGAAQRV